MNPEPDLEPSKELSYLLGVRYGDMRLMKERYVGILVKDKDFAEEFARCINVIFSKKCILWQDKRGHWGMSVSSRIFYEYMTLPLDLHKGIIEMFPEEFLRGFFDSEATVNSYNIRVGITDKDVLKYVEWLLNQLWIETRWYEFESDRKNIGRSYIMSNGSIVTCKKMRYTLDINKHDSRLLFSETIGFSIRRKAEKLREKLKTLGVSK